MAEAGGVGPPLEPSANGTPILSSSAESPLCRVTPKAGLDQPPPTAMPGLERWLPYGDGLANRYARGGRRGSGQIAVRGGMTTESFEYPRIVTKMDKNETQSPMVIIEPPAGLSSPPLRGLVGVQPRSSQSLLIWASVGGRPNRISGCSAVAEWVVLRHALR